MNEQKKIIKEGISLRIKWLYVAMVLVALVIVVRIIELQFNKTACAHSKVIHKNIIYRDTIRAYRGSIFDRDGRPLAISIFRKQVQTEFGSEAFDNRESFEYDVDSLAKMLALFFKDRSASEYRNLMLTERKKRYKLVNPRPETIHCSRLARFFGGRDSVYTTYDVKRSYKPMKFFRDVDYNEWEYLKRLPILQAGANQIREFDHRIYPQGNLALRTIGRNEEYNKYGIEYAYRDKLAGTNGSRLVQVITPGIVCRVEGSKDVKPIDGMDIVTTLDMDCQDVVTEALRTHLIKEEAWWGTSIVMECATGEIMAMANLGRTKQGDYVESRNYAIGQPMEPGSTFKLVSSMALLEDAHISPNKRYQTGLGKPVQIAPNIPKRVRDDHAIREDCYGHPTNGEIDMRTAFAESSNVYFTRAIHEAYIDDPSRYERYLRRLHLDQKMGLEELGAKDSYIPDMAKIKKDGWAPTALVNMGYGYTLQLTPLQTLTIYNAVANNGRMVAPRIIKRIEHNGKVVEEFPTKVIDEKICSDNTLSTLRSFMEEVALTGTAESYFGEKNCPFRVGGKTGTAQVAQTIDGVAIRYSDNYYLGSMVIYLPADNPKYTIMTAICKKRGVGTYYGAGLAGPVQKKIATFLYNRDTEVPCTSLGDESSNRPATIKGGNLSHIREVASEHSLSTKDLKRSGWGVSSVTPSGRVTAEGQAIEAGRVPNVVGMGLADALFLLESCGAQVTANGTGCVVRQSIAHGATIAPGERITIELR